MMAWEALGGQGKTRDSAPGSHSALLPYHSTASLSYTLLLGNTEVETLCPSLKP